jgi:hypothetical protein
MIGGIVKRANQFKHLHEIDLTVQTLLHVRQDFPGPLIHNITFRHLANSL